MNTKAFQSFKQTSTKTNMNEAAIPTPHWSPFQKLVFRFFFLYFLLYCFPFPLDAIEWTNPIVQPYFSFLDFIIKKIGTHLLHMPVRVAFPGFDKVDDSYYGLTFLFTGLVLTVVGTLIWSILDRQRKNYSLLNKWFQFYLRYFLATYLLGYGFVKFFPSQFEEVTASRLVMQVGEQTPMLLAWNFMGYSVAFSRISGTVEIIAGLLLFFQRTTTLGAMLATITFGFVTLLDYCFNVPVKLLVSHLMLISLVVLLNDGRRLFYLLLLNKPVEAVTYSPFFKKQSWRKGFVILQAICIAGILWKTIVESLDAAKQWGRYAPRVSLYGIYQTDIFIRNGDTIPPLQTESFRWKQLVIDGGSWKQSGLITFNDDQKTFYNIKADTAKQMMRIQSIADTLNTYTFHFVTPTTNHLLLEGKWMNDSIKVFLTKTNIDSFNLYSDRFHIVND